MDILKPFQFKRSVLKNRIVLASMGTNLGDPEGLVTDEMISYYAERTRGKVGPMMTELVAVDFPRGNGIERQLSIGNGTCIPGLRRLITEMQK